ncbi:MAG: PIN domain-containing protein [Chloroflexi bacterium]|nr:PIN domain-containing protein [Chloroflexota bacterium]
MIAAVDTSILLDLLIPNAPRAEQSEALLAEASRAGAIVLSEPVYAELAASFPAREDLDQFLDSTGMRLERSGAEALHRAGGAWREYSARRPSHLVCPRCGNAQPVQCSRCGRTVAPRQHLVADFLIGAHALVHANRLLTHDRGFYTTYFPELTLVP